MCNFYAEAPHARRAHPKPDHIMPAAVIAGVVAVPANDSGWALCGEREFSGWIRETMSLACYKFTNSPWHTEGGVVWKYGASEATQTRAPSSDGSPGETESENGFREAAAAAAASGAV